MALGIAEVYMRVAGYPGWEERKNFNFDPWYGTIYKKSWVFNVKDRERKGGFQINQDEVPVSKPSNEKRILFIGDSGTLGVGVSSSENFPALIQAELKKSEKDGITVRVINAGVPGMDTINELRLFEDELSKLRPDKVVLGLFMANDLNFNVSEADEFLSGRKPSFLKSVIWYLRGKSALVHFLFLQVMAHRLTFAANQDSHGFEFLNYLEGELAMYERAPSDLVLKVYSVFENAIERFSELSKQQGFEFAVVLIPTSSTVDRKLRFFVFSNAEETLKRRGLSEMDLDFDAPTRVVLGICKKHGIVCIDPLSKTRNYTAEQFIVAHDDHPSALGHRAIAESLTNWVRK